MKNILFLLTLACFVFIGCDGQDRVGKSNTEVLEENKLLDSFAENISYHPKKYSEVITDSSFSNGFNVKIKNYTDMKNAVLQSNSEDTIIYKHYFRKLISNVVINKNSKEIFNTTLDATFFKKIDGFEKIDLDSCIISTQINESSSPEKNNIILTCMFYEVKLNKLTLYDIIINETGNYTIEESKKLYTYTE